MAAKRDDAIKAFATLGVTQQQLFEALEVTGPDDIDQERYLNLVGMHQAIRSGKATIEEMFPVKRRARRKAGQSRRAAGRVGWRTGQTTTELTGGLGRLLAAGRGRRRRSRQHGRRRR